MHPGKGTGEKIYPAIEENITLCGNPDAVRQLISVLLDNALKYSDENGTIRLDIYQIHGKKKIEVFNTCVLEDTKNLSRLFDRFTVRMPHAPEKQGEPESAFPCQGCGGSPWRQNKGEQ